jgi:molybdenum cofactor cytidylyltransferase
MDDRRSERATSFVTGLVLAAGGSKRLGQPKQLLPYRGRPLLQSALDISAVAGFDQLLVTVGGAADEVLAAVEIGDAAVVINDEYGSGCSSSIVAALGVVDSRSVGIVLMLGDQPEVSVQVISRLIAAADPTAMGVCRYTDGRGHPFWLGRSVFAEQADLHGDKGVWKVLESGRHPVFEVAVDAPVPLDVDTWADYKALVRSAEGAPR